jgi:hypothetical protein
MTVTVDRAVTATGWPRLPTPSDWQALAEDLGWILRSGEHTSWVWRRLGAGREAIYKRLRQGAEHPDVSGELAAELTRLYRDLVRRGLVEADQVVLLARQEHVWAEADAQTRSTQKASAA